MRHLRIRSPLAGLRARPQHGRQSGQAVLVREALWMPAGSARADIGDSQPLAVAIQEQQRRDHGQELIDEEQLPQPHERANRRPCWTL